MHLDRKLLDDLSDADNAGQVAYTRHLCERLLDSNPDHGTTLIRYASCLIQLCLYDAAAVVLDRAEAVVPAERRHHVLAQRGHRFDRMGDFDNALRQHLAAHDLDPDDATYLIYAGSIAFRSGDIGHAIDLARRALTCSEGCLDEAHFNLGGYLLAQKRYLEARDCYLQALGIDPDYSIAKDRLADVERVVIEEGEQAAASDRY